MSDNVTVRGEDFYLNPERLSFNEATLSQYLQEEAAWYNHVGQKLADARAELQSRELHSEAKYAEKFSHFKDQGGSDKLAESNAKADVEVEASKEAVIIAKQVVESIQNYLRALDKAHDNAQSFGHMLRKEMDKLMTDIRRSADGEMDRKIDDIISASR